MVASRRDDGNYTRPYIAYFDKNGKTHKAFEVPQKDPNFYTFFLRSFNRPEFMIVPPWASTDWVSISKSLYLMDELPQFNTRIFISSIIVNSKLSNCKLELL